MKNELYKRAKFFMNRNQPVHVSKKNYWFNNGIIKELSAEFLIIVDEVVGEMPVFFSEIYEIEPREPKLKNGGRDGGKKTAIG